MIQVGGGGGPPPLAARAMEDTGIERASRTGLLRLNGWRIEVEADDAHERLIGLLEAGEANYDNLLAWIREHLKRM